jgi:L-fuculose-phosphate aldolase
LRLEVVSAARRLEPLGLTQGTSGNISARTGDGMLVTPSALPYSAMNPEDLVLMDLAGGVHDSAPEHRPSTEWRLHAGILRGRPDVGAVVHAHPPNATAIGASRQNPLDRPFIAEALVSLGPKIPTLPYSQPGDAARAALAPWCELVDVVLLGNHGVIAWGEPHPRDAALAVIL